jgi:signal transduction histidine kinase
MVRTITAKIKPVGGFSHLVHVVLTVLLPILVFVFVRIHLANLAVAIILLSKWRMFAVKPRHWPANIRANAIDITVGLSFLIFMTHSGTQTFQLFWTILYGIWLIVLKPRSDQFSVSLQALIGQMVGLSAVFLSFGDSPVWVLTLLAWLICYAAARHFLTSFDEPLARFLSYLWGYFAAALVWILAHWLLFYGAVAQPTLLLSVIGFGLAGLYYLERTDRLSLLYRRQIVFVMIAVIVIVLTFSDWGDKTIR